MLQLSAVAFVSKAVIHNLVNSFSHYYIDQGQLIVPKKTVPNTLAP